MLWQGVIMALVSIIDMAAPTTTLLRVTMMQPQISTMDHALMPVALI